MSVMIEDCETVRAGSMHVVKRHVIVDVQSVLVIQVVCVHVLVLFPLV